MFPEKLDDFDYPHSMGVDKKKHQRIPFRIAAEALRRLYQTTYFGCGKPLARSDLMVQGFPRYRSHAMPCHDSIVVIDYRPNIQVYAVMADGFSALNIADGVTGARSA
jgi:hypothetical protein